ncbi:MAG: hypothetical protein M1821_005199 [Bathelium mastoideum]|nr:MAG: hypothetical protein M1821_005199 [Bathelium mastoideum]
MSAMQAPADGDRNRGPQLVALYWTEGAIAILIVALRVYCRVTMRQMGLDDYMMLFTLALFLILAGFVTYYASIGGCRHLFYLTPTQQLLAVKYNWITQPWGIFGFGTGKISVALLILRILGPNIFWRKWILYVTMAVVFTTTSLACILTFVQCDPPRALWTPQLVAEHKATCWNPKAQSDYAIFFSCNVDRRRLQQLYATD